MEVMEREELAARHSAALEAYISSGSRTDTARILRMTSGTTGRGPMLFLMPHPDPRWYGQPERAVLAFGSVHLRAGYAMFLLTDPACREPRVMALDKADLGPELEALMADFRPDNLVGFISLLSRIFPFLGSAASSVKSVCVTGEAMTQRFLEALGSSVPQSRLQAIYMAGETGPMTAITCGHLPPNHYHLLESVRIEIAEPDSEGVGDILVSKVANGSVVLENYRVGDIGRFHDAPCPCGQKRSLEVVGRRGHDYVKLAGILLRREEFDRVAGLSGGHIDDYRVEVLSRGDGPASVLLKIWRRDARPDTQAVKRTFLGELFVTQTRLLVDAVRDGTLTFDVEAVSEPFPLLTKEIKIRSI